MEEEEKRVSRLQKKTAYDVVIRNYEYLVRHVDAIRTFPHLVSSELVEPDFSQYLELERTDKDKIMALLREFLRSPMEGWFRDFIGALSKFPQYQVICDTLLTGREKETHACMQHVRTFSLCSNAPSSLCRL